MFFENCEIIPELAQKSGFSLFITPFDFTISSKKAIKTAKTQTLTFPKNQTTIIEPEQSKIRINQIREINDLITVKTEKDHFIIVKNAETMNTEAQNAFLKILEEPKANYHFVLFSKETTGLLETVLSRASIFIFRQKNLLEQPVSTEDRIKDLAKRLIAADNRELVRISNELSDKKLHKDPREDSKKVVATSIEILYKSYFSTKNPKFLVKIERFIRLYDNLQKNGHVKLHLVADLC